MKNLRDSGAERALLGSVLRYGKDAFIDSDGIVDPTDFALPINRAVYSSFQSLAEEENCQTFDVETIKMKIKSLGLEHTISTPKDLEYLELLNSVNFEKDNIPMFALQIKKYSVARDLYSRYNDAVKYLEGISGNETLSDIIQNAEGKIIDFVSGIEGASSLESLTDNIMDYIDQVLQAEEVDQVGLPTGFPLYDEAIGGGPRRGTVTVVGARSKIGKSFHALNTGLNVAKRGIPVLYLDTELTGTYQKARLVCMNSGCPLWLFETGKFKRDKDLTQAVVESSREIKDANITYNNISGMSHTEALAIARRWIVKEVGFNDEGKANDCLIIYDYLKLTSGDSLTKVTPEYIVLGLMLTEMHNFSIKYDIPILGYVQLNREGIDGDDTSVIAGSDRILWLCSSMSIIKNKDDNDISLGCGWDHGNKKLLVLDTRQGSGLEVYGDYINLHASLRPMVSRESACGFIREGMLFSQVNTGYNNNGGSKDKQSNAGSPQRGSEQ